MDAFGCLRLLALGFRGFGVVGEVSLFPIRFSCMALRVSRYAAFGGSVDFGFRV